MRVIQGFFRDSVRNYIGIPQGVDRKIHGAPIGILQGVLKGIQKGMYKEPTRIF